VKGNWGKEGTGEAYAEGFVHGFRVVGVCGSAVLAGAGGVRAAALVAEGLAAERSAGRPRCEASRGKHCALGGMGASNCIMDLGVGGLVVEVRLA